MLFFCGEFGLFPTILFWNTGPRVGGGPEKNQQLDVSQLFLPSALWLLNLAISKLFKRSVNDEKWRDCFVPCFVAMISAKISASGEVGASQNMAE